MSEDSYAEEFVLLLVGEFGELDFGDDFDGFDFIGEAEDVELHK